MGGLEDAELPVAFEVEEAGEGVGLGDAEVVAGEEAEAAASPQQVAEVGLDAVEAARHDEADGDVGCCGLGQLADQVGEEGVVLASRDEPGAGAGASVAVRTSVWASSTRPAPVLGAR